jgi:hypothetical protein
MEPLQSALKYFRSEFEALIPKEDVVQISQVKQA